MVILKNFKNIFLIPELTRKLLFTLGVLIIERLGTFIPVIGVNVPLLAEHMSKATALGGLLSHFDILSGGALQQSTLFALGIGPYITASIMMQMLGMTIPRLEALLKEGEYGRKVINQYTRYLALLLAIGYSAGFAFYLERQGLVLTPGWGFRLLFIISLSVGAMFVMWLGEQISLFGVGNGSSMIIFAGIVARIPDYVLKTIDAVQKGFTHPIKAILMWAIFLFIAACVVFLEKGERKIPVQYARRVIGNRMYGGQSSYIPFKINTAGVMPVIFASSFLNLPLFLSSMLAERFALFKGLAGILSYNGAVYNALEFLLIIFFTFFYTELVFNPTELADNMKKNGGFIPGLRPGKKTAEFFEYILTRIGLVGAVYLACLAIAPNIINTVLQTPFSLGGTSILIIVGVALELAAQIESYLIEHRYEGFLTTGRMKGRLVR